MSKFGDDLVAAMKEALAYAQARKAGAGARNGRRLKNRHTGTAAVNPPSTDRRPWHDG